MGTYGFAQYLADVRQSDSEKRATIEDFKQRINVERNSTSSKDKSSYDEDRTSDEEKLETTNRALPK